MRPLIALLFLAVPAVVFAQASDPAVLETLAAQDNRVGIAAYVKARFPRFHDAAVKAGLAEWLDGAIDFKTFRGRVSGHTAELDLLSKVGTLQPATGVKLADVYAAGALEDPVKMAELLRSSLYNADNHPLTRALNADRWGRVSVEARDGKLVWFNPYLDIPELGIKAGEPMTAAQRDAILKLYAIKTVPAGGGSVGTAFYPEDVGRALNPTAGVVSIITGEGKVVPETVSKGTGPNPGVSRDGLLDLSEAYMDAEVSRNLMKAGAAPYVPVAVIDIGDGKAIYVRASGSLLRHSHLEKYSAAEIEKLAEHLMSNRTLGYASPAEALQKYVAESLPRQVGRNAGLLSGIGIKHGSLGSDNYGLRGELVDWGWAELGHQNSDAQKDSQWELVEKAVKKSNPILAEMELRALDRAGLDALAKANDVPVDGTEAEVRERIARRMEGGSLELKGLDKAQLESIVKANGGYTYGSDTIPELSKKAVEKIKSLAAGEAIQGADRPVLETLAKSNGIAFDAADTDARLSEKIAKELGAWRSKAKLDGLSRQVDLDAVKAAFEAEYGTAKTEGAKFDVKLAERFMQHAEESTLRDLAKGFGAGYGTSKQDALDLLKRNGIVEADADMKQLPPEPDPVAANDRARMRSRAKAELAGAGQFAAAFLVKEAFKAIETGDPAAMKHALREVATARFWGDLAVFTVAARAAEHLPLGHGLLRMGVPLAAGMAAVQVLHGKASLKDVMIDTAAFLAAGAVVGAIADGLIYPALFAAGPPGWIAAGVYTVAKLAVTLYAGEKLGAWMRGLFDRGSHDDASHVRREGVKQKLEAVGK